MSDLVQSVFDLSGVNSITVVPGSKQENSIVERANREVMRHLKNIVYDVRVLSEWSIYLPFAQRIMNSMIHSSTGVRPCEIVFGRDIGMEIITTADGEDSTLCVLKSIRVKPLERVERDVGGDTMVVEEQKAIEVEKGDDDEEEWLKEIRKAQQLAIDVAKEHLISKDMKHMMRAPKDTDSFIIGDMVLIEQGSSFRRGPDDKLLPFLAGPYVVEEVKGSEYLLRNCITRRTKLIHLSNLHKYNQSVYHRPPEEAAMRDVKDFFMVEKISGVDPKNNTSGPLSALRFKVAWKGYPNQDTWENWKNLRNLEQFRNFLSEHPKKSYRKLLKHLLRKKDNNLEEPAGIGVQQNESDKVEIESETTGKIRLKGTKRRKEATTLSEDGPRRGKRERKRFWKFGEL
jgi:hypothetical protein